MCDLERDRDGDGDRDFGVGELDLGGGEFDGVRGRFLSGRRTMLCVLEYTRSGWRVWGRVGVMVVAGD